MTVNACETFNTWLSPRIKTVGYNYTSLVSGKSIFTVIVDQRWEGKHEAFGYMF